MASLEFMFNILCTQIQVEVVICCIVFPSHYKIHNLNCCQISHSLIAQSKSPACQRLTESSGAIATVSLIFILDALVSVLPVASSQALAAARASSLFLISSGERNSSF